MHEDGYGPLYGDDLPPLDPREALSRDRHHEPSAGLVYLRTIAAEERQWMEKMVEQVAAHHHVDRDDLLQDLRLSLLTCDSIDPGRTELRAWLIRRARWKALDLQRNAGRQRTDQLESAPDPPAPEPNRIDTSWDVDASWRLPRDEAQIVRLICWGLDLSLRDLSALIGRSYAEVRHDKHHALRKIKDFIGLSPDELTAFLAFRRFPTYPDAATHLDLPEEELRARVHRAHDKVRQALERSVTDDPEEEGRSDES